MEVTIDALGRVLIPKKVRNRLGLVPNSKLDLKVEDGAVLLSPKDGSIELVQTESGALVIRGLPPVSEELIQKVHEDQLLGMTGRLAK